MFFSSSVTGAIHGIASSLQMPAIIILLIFVIIVMVELGSLTVEAFFERRKSKVKVASLLTEVQNQEVEEIQRIVRDSKLLKRQKSALNELLENSGLAPSIGQALARRILSTEELRCQKVVSLTDMIVRLGPMFGLMATLIPLGPGLIALGQGDTKTLADSLLTAFDATVAGLATAGVAFVVSKLRKRWYEDDMISMEAIMEGILEEMYRDESRIEK
ncbi:MAG: MotA/TolQ/ExbB proton channel family protein [Anaerovorax sp.]